MIIFFICLFIMFIVLGVIADEDGFVGTGLTGLLATGVFIFISVLLHISDLSKVRAYQGVIAVQEARVTQLTDTLNKMGVKTNSSILLNQDSPVKAMVESLDSSIRDLTNARNEVALAKVGIERRKIGPFWFVISMYGDK